MLVDIGLIAVGNDTCIKTIKTMNSTQMVIYKYNRIMSKCHKLWITTILCQTTCGEIETTTETVVSTRNSVGLMGENREGTYLDTMPPPPSIYQMLF